MTQNIAALTERNIALFNALNDIDDRRERLLKASSTGRHEPSAIFGGLYDVEEVDDGGRLIERRERSASDPFVPLADLAAPNDEAIEPEQAVLPDTGAEPFAADSLERVEELRYLVWRDDQPAVILRRRTALRAL